MSPRTETVDAVVVGAGTAGANAAYQLACQGRTVILVERRPAGQGGAHWNNGVLDWQFKRAGLAEPSGPERFANPVRSHLFGPDGTPAVTLDPSPTVSADMGRLGRRLRSLAVTAGVELIHGLSGLAVRSEAGRVRGLDLELFVPGDRDLPRIRRRIDAALVVDASGRGGAVRRQSAELSPWCPPVRGPELCSAGDLHLRIGDRDAARRFLDHYGAAPGDNISLVGSNGGYSTVGVTVMPDEEQVGLLVGCLADGRHGTAPQMVSAVRRAQPWIGEMVRGGFGVIPLRRPYSRLTAPGVALVGDAAGQVVPAHGSGIGMGLIAGRLLAEALEGSDDPGAESVLWRYQAAFQREFGGLMVAFDAFRRMSTELGTVGVRDMVRARLLTEAMAYAGLNQTWAYPDPKALPALTARLLARPRLASVMLPRLARGQLAQTLGESYPRDPDLVALCHWDARAERLLGPLP